MHELKWLQTTRQIGRKYQSTASACDEARNKRWTPAKGNDANITNRETKACVKRTAVIHIIKRQPCTESFTKSQKFDSTNETNECETVINR